MFSFDKMGLLLSFRVSLETVTESGMPGDRNRAGEIQFSN